MLQLVTLSLVKGFVIGFVTLADKLGIFLDNISQSAAKKRLFLRDFFFIFTILQCSLTLDIILRNMQFEKLSYKVRVKYSAPKYFKFVKLLAKYELKNVKTVTIIEVNWIVS